MQYLLLLYVDESGWDRLTPAQKAEGLAAYTAYGEALRKAGAFINSNRLSPAATATTVRVRDGKSQVLDGPYTETKEQVGGYYLIDAPDLDAAIAWAAKVPSARHGSVEVRPVWA